MINGGGKGNQKVYAVRWDHQHTILHKMSIPYAFSLDIPPDRSFLYSWWLLLSWLTVKLISFLHMRTSFLWKSHYIIFKTINNFIFSLFACILHSHISILCHVMKEFLTLRNHSQYFEKHNWRVIRSHS